MVDVKNQQISFIHGWLLGSFIWNDIDRYFKHINNTNFITLSGYSSDSPYLDDYEIINATLKMQSDNDILIAYSYSASLILYSKYLESCKGNIFLINPFFKKNQNSIDKLIHEIHDDVDLGIKKFIYESTKGDRHHKKSYSKLCNLLKDNYVPSKDSLCLGLTNIKKICSQPLLIKDTKKVHIIQTTNDHINDLDYFFNFEKQEFNTYKLEGLTHYPFFHFDKIYEIIKNKV
tara:strand:- start:1116 stop:1811 length:696 start_codon:yes stop_codon:yes gene_type:complete